MAKTRQETIMEALAGLIPAEAAEKTTNAIATLLDESVKAIEAEAEKNLEDAYATVAAERAEDWKTAEAGYAQAYEVIEDLRNRLTLQKEEFESHMTNEFGVAKKMLEEEKSKNENLEQAIYEDMNKKLQESREWLIDKVDAFLAKQGEEYYEAARREVLSDPCLAEHRVALERVIDVVGDFVGADKEYVGGQKAAELTRSLEQAEIAKQRLEAKNHRLMRENTDMQKLVVEAKQMVEGKLLMEQQERQAKAKKVQGSGKVVMSEREVVIGEAADQKQNATTEDKNVITENWQRLAGLK